VGYLQAFEGSIAWRRYFWRMYPAVLLNSIAASAVTGRVARLNYH